jgi:hypothetical protein
MVTTHSFHRTLSTVLILGTSTIFAQNAHATWILDTPDQATVLKMKKPDHSHQITMNVKHFDSHADSSSLGTVTAWAFLENVKSIPGAGNRIADGIFTYVDRQGQRIALPIRAIEMGAVSFGQLFSFALGVQPSRGRTCAELQIPLQSIQGVFHAANQPFFDSERELVDRYIDVTFAHHDFSGAANGAVSTSVDSGFMSLAVHSPYESSLDLRASLFNYNERLKLTTTSEEVDSDDDEAAQAFAEARRQLTAGK